ncbi:MAG: hypothetical protein RLZ12_779 [Bacillota bacterium]|jgi:D-alanyl-D-alanine carboxypeptidase
MLYCEQIVLRGGYHLSKRKLSLITALASLGLLFSVQQLLAADTKKKPAKKTSATVKALPETKKRLHSEIRDLKKVLPASPATTEELQVKVQKTGSSTSPTESTIPAVKQEQAETTNFLILVNKTHPISPANLPTAADLREPEIAIKRDPDDVITDTRLRKEAATTLKELAAAAQQAGITIMINNGFRTHEDQERVKAYFRDELHFSPDALSKRVADPGLSEHHTGLAADLATTTTPFVESNAYHWLCLNAPNFGFVERYTTANKAQTVYGPEPWHWRFVGSKEVAEAVKAAGSLEAYLEQLAT